MGCLEGRIKRRRRKIAQNAREAIAAFHAGKLKPQPVEEIIAELRQSLDEAIEEYIHFPFFNLGSLGKARLGRGPKSGMRGGFVSMSFTISCRPRSICGSWPAA